MPIFGSASFSDAATVATVGVRAICATDAVVPLSASLRLRCSAAAVGASRASSSAGLIMQYMYGYQHDRLAKLDRQQLARDETLVPIKP